MKKEGIIIYLLIAVTLVIPILLYSQMPEMMVTHWNTEGNPDGTMSRFWGLAIMPIVAIAILLTYLWIPKIDPLKKNIATFRKYFDWFIIILLIFFIYVYSLTIAWNLGRHFNMTRFMLPAIGMIFIYAGILMKHAKRNWFIGIRTPWTLSSEYSWKKTHELGAKLFIIAGALSFIGIFIPAYAFAILIGPIIAFTVLLIVYSYFMYKKKK